MAASKKAEAIASTYGKRVVNLIQTPPPAELRQVMLEVKFAAIDRVALEEGFNAWSLLASKASSLGAAGRMFARLTPGDLVLVGSRPGHGKTLLSLELAMQAMQSGDRSVFFTLEYTQEDVIERFRVLGADRAKFAGLFAFDDSDAISADHIIDRLALAPRGTLVIVDYLQLLDQKRQNPPLMDQIRMLKVFARERGLIMIFISQIDRSYDPAKKPWPDLANVRLPNPLDLTLFTKVCFLQDGEVQFRSLS